MDGTAKASEGNRGTVMTFLVTSLELDAGEDIIGRSAVSLDEPPNMLRTEGAASAIFQSLRLQLSQWKTVKMSR
jgi:hypothetical protein